MTKRRQFLRGLAVLTSLAVLAPRIVVAASPATNVVKAFYDALLATMKDGPKLGFAGRRDKLAPAVALAFDLPQMTRLAVGPRWQSLGPQQNDLIAAFAAYTIATYANRFADYSGERFEVDTDATPSNDAMVVHSKLIKKSGDPVQLDYLVKQSGASWKIVDVYLSGTVSELATRRSEFSSILNRGGAQALIDELRRKSVEQH